MKNQVLFVIFLFFGFAFLVYLFPVIFVEGAKVESGVTIKETAPPTNETAPPTNEICNNGIDDNGNGAIDEVTCLPPPAGPAAGTCGLQIVSGVPINYGQLNPGQGSAEQKVTIKNLGTATAKIMVKGGNWISDAAGNPTISGPDLTHVSMSSTGSIHPSLYNSHMPLTSNGTQIGWEVGRPEEIYFQVWIPSSFSGFGSHHQEVTIDLLC